METKDFELEFEEETDSTHFTFWVEGEAKWDIENDSFDYAGTHCTGGMSGTCELPDYAVVEEISIGFVMIEKTTDSGEEVIKYTWKKNKDKVKEFEEIWEEKIKELLQTREDDTGDVMRRIKDHYEELRLGI